MSNMREKKAQAAPGRSGGKKGPAEPGKLLKRLMGMIMKYYGVAVMQMVKVFPTGTNL